MNDPSAPRPHSEHRKDALRTLVIGGIGGLIVIGVFVAGWALRGSENPSTAALAPTTPAVAISNTSELKPSTTAAPVEPYTGPALPLTLQELETRWNSLAEQKDSLLTITGLAADQEPARELESIGARASTFSYEWDNIELRGWVIEGDGRLYDIVVQGGVRCAFTGAGTSLTEVCEGTFEDSGEEFGRFTDLQDFLIGVLHPGLDPSSLTENWLIAPVGETDSSQVLDESGSPPVINGVSHNAYYGTDGYIIHVSPAES